MTERQAYYQSLRDEAALWRLRCEDQTKRADANALECDRLRKEL